MGALRADQGAAVGNIVGHKDSLAAGDLAVDQTEDRALTPPLEEGGLGADDVLTGFPVNLLGDLDEIVPANLDKVRGGGVVDLRCGEGRVLPKVEEGSLGGFEDLRETFSGEDPARFRMMPPPSPRRGLILSYDSIKRAHS